FQGASPLDVLEQVRSAEPVAPSRLAPKLPRDLETICLKCLQKEPKRRYPSAEALAEDLERFQRGEPIRARPVSNLERGWKWTKRRPAVAGLLLLVICLTVAGLGVTTSLWRAASSAFQRESSAHDKTESALAPRTIALARFEWLTNNRQRALGYLNECAPEYRGDDWQYLHRACVAQQFELSVRSFNIHHLAFSPDGRELVFASDEPDSQSVSGTYIRSWQ